MANEWVDVGDLGVALRKFSEKLAAWNRDVFGSIFKRKRRVQRRLEGVMKALENMLSVGLIKLERRLKREWSEVLLQEETL